MLGAVFVAAVAAIGALVDVDSAAVGFSLTLALRFTVSLVKLLKATAAVELSFNACERVLEYAEIETEPQDGQDVPVAWPSEGKIEFDNLTAAYSDELPPVLHNLNFAVNPGERIGIVGRTGAGKSTLAAVLFRIIKFREGSIRIDGLDISRLRLADLRSRLAIIPQDPFLFSGTLRSNLDAEGRLDESDLHAVLRRVHLTQGPSSSDMPSNTAGEGSTRVNSFENLDMPISAGGANLSQGQRQLVSLARTLLRRPKIVVLDEATSSIDHNTDRVIQESLRTEFAGTGCTVLVIAHRLSTIADFDRVLVLDAGKVVEIGTLRELMDASGAFRKLVSASKEREQLEEMILKRE